MFSKNPVSFIIQLICGWASRVLLYVALRCSCLANLEAFLGQMRYKIPPARCRLYSGSSYRLDVPEKASKGWRPGGILIRCPNYLRWPFLTQRSRGSTLSSLLISELLTLPLGFSQAALQDKLI